MRLRDVIKITSLTRTTIYNNMAKDEFPDDKVKGGIIHADDLDFLALQLGFNSFQAKLPISTLAIKKDVKKRRSS